jgi:hypothetical protein
MNDVLNARQRTQRFRPNQSVRIGDEAYRFRQRLGSAAQFRDRIRAPARSASWPVLITVFVLRNFAAMHKPASTRHRGYRRLDIQCRKAIRLRYSREMLVQHSNFGQHEVHAGSVHPYQQTGAAGERKRGTLVRRRCSSLARARARAERGLFAIHHDSGQCVLIFCQISDFQSYNANNKSNKSI